MFSIKFASEKVAANYQRLQPKNSSVLAPRQGFYLIHEVNHVQVGKTGSFPTAKCTWARKPTIFLEGLEFEIQLLSLYAETSIGPKEISVNDLIGKVIRVSESGSTIIEENQVIRERVYVNWEIVDQLPIFLTSTEVFLRFFFHGSETLLEANQKFQTTLDKNIYEEILDIEANQEIESFDDGYFDDDYFDDGNGDDDYFEEL